MSKILDGEVIGFDESEPLSNHYLNRVINNVQWKTADGEVIFIRDMEDSHLRNAALVLMDMGYLKTNLPNHKRVMYLSIFKFEWKRRRYLRLNGNFGTVREDEIDNKALMEKV